jgi:hypothetical protein
MDDVPDAGRMVPFIQHEGGQFKVCDEGANLLRSIEGTIAVVAVAGLYRTGKSFLLNQLVRGSEAAEQTQKGFAVGDTIQSCTRGINIWVPKHLKAADGSTLVLMDTEGMASMDQVSKFVDS